MIKFGESEAVVLNNLSPGNQNVKLGSRIKDLVEKAEEGGKDAQALIRLCYDITSDLSGGLDAIECPCDLEVLDVMAQARASSGSGTVTARKVTDDITSAIVMAVNEAMARTVSIDDAYSSFTEGQFINLVTNGAADRGLVAVVARRT